MSQAVSHWPKLLTSLPLKRDRIDYVPAHSVPQSLLILPMRKLLDPNTVPDKKVRNRTSMGVIVTGGKVVLLP